MNIFGFENVFRKLLQSIGFTEKLEEKSVKCLELGFSRFLNSRKTLWDLDLTEDFKT